MSASDAQVRTCSDMLNHYEAHKIALEVSKLKVGRARAFWQRAVAQLGPASLTQ